MTLYKIAPDTTASQIVSAVAEMDAMSYDEMLHFSIFADGSDLYLYVRGSFFLSVKLRDILTEVAE